MAQISNTVLFAALIVIVVLVIVIWRREKCARKVKTSRGEVLVISKQEKVYPRANIRPTFEKEGGFKFPVKSQKRERVRVPKSFSSIKNWQGMITGVYDQEKCGSCWAFSTTSCMTDRIRIASDGKYLTDGDYLSPFQLASCMKCGVGEICPDVCEGSYLDDVLDYLVENGAVQQSDIDQYGSGSEEYVCFDWRKHPITPWKGKRKYRVNIFPPSMLKKHDRLAANTRAIEEEIFLNGPVCCIIQVFIPPDSKNFYNYRSGIYGHNWKKMPKETDGYHAITIVGWGSDRINGKDIPYWIVRNSWGDDWGTSGFGKVLKGSNFAMIESDCWGITPDMKGHD